MTEQVRLLPLPFSNNHQGKPRRIGVEIELSGLELNELAELVAKELGLSTEQKGRYDLRLTGDLAGDWVVELDFHLLKELGKTEQDPGSLSQSAEQLLASLASQLVPLELVSPPLPFERLKDIEHIIDRLQQQGAKGSSDEFQNAFGLQLNPEIPSKDPAVLLRFLQAFVCLHDWLLQQEQIDVTRRLTSYINPYPKDYQKLILAPDYQPDLTQLIDDYLTHNPTRNRALDCLPLFMELDESRVKAAVKDELVKARPTFHYRLPSSEIQLAGWGLHRAWNGWIKVEQLVANPDQLSACAAAYLELLNKPLGKFLQDWPHQLEQQWLNR
ncbi:amidoligase family protein [Alkalimonas sp. MEB108]|uniref:Amidoligase family protein n=1 Tax=Alkalimonas cellulosilytica TaxID=3058395 RepID=A0ABU7J1X3_9GAMM|nr:amidoligase family protein [Alkalimonas sp. MEB108]MEE2000005.1 amidoligase family protein [Alkalimonas sp. MEB108]